MRKLTLMLVVAMLVSFATPVLAAGAREAARPDEPVELWMNTLFHGGDAQAMEMIVEQFNASHQDIQIDLMQGGWTEYFAQLNNAVVAGEAPQIGISLNFRMLDIYPALTPLNDSPAGNLLERYGFNRSDYVEEVWDIASIDGNQYGIPLDNTMLGIYYNKQIFRDAGLDPDNPPQTLAEFQRAADAIRDAGYYAYHPGAYGQARWYRRMWYVYLWQKGGRLIENERAAFNNQTGRDALEFLVTTRTRGWNEPGTNGAAQFDAGELGMMVNGTWHYLNLARGDLDWGFMGMPKFFDHQYTWGSNHFLVIPRQSGRDAERYVDAAAQAIKWMSENSHTWGIYGGHVPLRRTALESSELRNSETWQKSLGLFTDMAFGGVYRPLPVHPKINEINAAIEPYIEEAYNGDISVADALARGERAVNDVLR
ncbi:MAG: extracellular solute-binding protein [Spirochaetaceae bacterium]|nr:MAG: extracellular solute-binding protein [Spirochaetaceae bacterium]